MLLPPTLNQWNLDSRAVLWYILHVREIQHATAVSANCLYSYIDIHIARSIDIHSL